MSHFPKTRLRRLRQSQRIRNLVSETKLDIDKLILPLFIRFGENIKKPIASLPGQYQLSVDQLEKEINHCLELGIKNIFLFGIPEKKDEFGSDSYDDNGIIQTAIDKIKNVSSDMLVIADVCLCEYTNHGHCGVVNKFSDNHFEIDNDKTLELLGKQSVSFAKAGADIVAPSGMMDGMVQVIRTSLDNANFKNVPILSYSVKYASSMYGPFRDAAGGSAPKFGDRRTHQMNYANVNEALRECELDINEGADMLMVKPAHTYLDVIRQVKSKYPGLPLGAYHTSGEYAMLKAAAEKGWVNEKAAVLEVLTAIHRAGADFILTYYAKDVAHWLQQ